MKGFMRQRGGSWELRVYLGEDPVTGRLRYASRTVRAGKREAQRVLSRMVSEAERGVMARTTATVGELLDAWMELAERDFSPKTVLETRRVIEGRLKPGLGSVSLAKLRTADIDRFYRKLQTAGGQRGTALAPGTVRRPTESCAERCSRASGGAGSALTRRQPRRRPVCR